MRVGAALLALCVVVGGCTRSVATDPTAPAVTDTGTVATTSQPVTTPATSMVTTPPPTVPSPSTSPTTSPAAASEPSSSAPEASGTSATAEAGGSEVATTTTEPIAQTLLVLSGEGIGSNVFGAEPEGVIEAVTATLGGNTDDTGWVDSQALGTCPGTKTRRVEWGTLKLYFGDSSAVTTDRDHFFAWEYGQVSELGGEPAGLRSAGGTTLGSSVTELQAEFPDAVVTAAPEDIDGPSTYSVSDTFFGWLSGPNPDDVVLVMFGGTPCG